MFSHLFANWKQIYSNYKDFGEDGLDAKNIGDFCENPDGPDGNLMYCYQPMTVLEKPLN